MISTWSTRVTFLVTIVTSTVLLQGTLSSKKGVDTVGLHSQSVYINIVCGVVKKGCVN